MSTPENPFGSLDPEPLPEPRPGVPDNVTDAGLAERFPLWTIWDLCIVALVCVAASFVTALVTFMVVLALPAYAHASSDQIARDPKIIVPIMVVAYMITIFFIYRLIVHHYRLDFWDGIRWRWPRSWVLYLVGGCALSLVLQIVSHFLPIPKELPIDELFKTPGGVWMMAIFGTLVAPFAEELFFRGLLYPVLARSIGEYFAVLLTGVGFALIHAGQLGWSWAALSVLLAVGIALTLVRALAKSLAASMLVHIGYNGFIFGLVFIGTHGFTKL